jgi:hypothetical protein
MGVFDVFKNGPVTNPPPRTPDWPKHSSVMVSDLYSFCFPEKLFDNLVPGCQVTSPLGSMFYDGYSWSIGFYDFESAKRIRKYLADVSDSDHQFMAEYKFSTEACVLHNKFKNVIKSDGSEHKEASFIEHDFWFTTLKDDSELSYWKLSCTDVVYRIWNKDEVVTACARLGATLNDRGYRFYV